MQFLSMLFDLFETGWLLLSLVSLGIGAMYLFYKLLQDIIFNGEHNWLSKLLNTIVFILVIIGSYFYWWYNYYLPVKPSTNYYEEEAVVKEEPKTSSINKKKHITLEELNKRSAHSGMDEDSIERHLQSQ